MDQYLAFVTTSLQILFYFIGNSFFLGKMKLSTDILLSLIVLIVIGSTLFQMVGVIAIVLIFLANSWINYRILKKWLPSIGIQSLIMVIFVITDHLTSWLLNIVTHDFNYLTLSTVILHLSMELVFSLLLIKISKWSVRKYLDDKLDSNEGNIISLILLFTYSIYLICILLGVQLGNTIELIQLNLVFFLLYLFFTITAFFFYSRAVRKEYQIKQTKAEYEAIQQYTEGLESQYNEIRKFRHDYKNILSSIDSYIDEHDLDGLRNYFRNYVLETSEFVTIDNFKLDDLAKIQVKEIKSLLMSKLLRAQSLNIDTTFECREIIREIPTSPLDLIRVLGILIDNAIEEIIDLGFGTLRVAFFSKGEELQIVIENTCRQKIEPIYQLQKQGYSTKEDSRGLGLSNVGEIVSKSDSLAIETIIEKGIFIQIIYILKK
ncbi:MAG: GHKL domain-containing protein [Enterococcus sp.]|nr:GHKL domain-containing protein [Enterococcus sp.]